MFHIPIPIDAIPQTMSAVCRKEVKMNTENILEVKDLHVDIHMTEGLLTAVRGVNFEMKKGETLGLVGESGCGKSLTCKAILGINDKKCKSSGQILFDSEGLGKVDLL